MSGLGVDYETESVAPALVAGVPLPGTVVAEEVKPNWVTIEGSDGSIHTARDSTATAGIGQVGEWVVYSYVLDENTLREIAETRLNGNVNSAGAAIELLESSTVRPWVDFYVGDVIYVDIGFNLPRGWYRVESIRAQFTDEAEGLRYVVDVGSVIVPEDAAVADRLAAILYSGLIDLETGLPTGQETGQASTTVIIQSDDIPVHTHTLSDLPTIYTGGDLSGAVGTATVQRVQGYEHSNTPAPSDDTWQWQWWDQNQIMVLAPAPVQQSFTWTGDAEVSTGTIEFPIVFDTYIMGVYARANGVPTGADLIFDVNLNGTSIYATTPANRPTVTDGSNASQLPMPAPDTVAAVSGDRLSIDIDQIGSTTPGSDIVIVVQFGRDVTV